MYNKDFYHLHCIQVFQSHLFLLLLNKIANHCLACPVAQNIVIIEFCLIWWIFICNGSFDIVVITLKYLSAEWEIPPLIHFSTFNKISVSVNGSKLTFLINPG